MGSYERLRPHLSVFFEQLWSDFGVVFDEEVSEVLWKVGNGSHLNLLHTFSCLFQAYSENVVGALRGRCGGVSEDRCGNIGGEHRRGYHGIHREDMLRDSRHMSDILLLFCIALLSPYSVTLSHEFASASVT